jgi:hypothetical protein
LTHICALEQVRVIAVVSAIVVVIAAFALVAAERLVLTALGAGPAELWRTMVSNLMCSDEYQQLTASSLWFLSMFFEK